MARYIILLIGTGSSVAGRGKYLWYLLPNIFLDRSAEKGRGVGGYSLPALVHRYNLWPPSGSPAH